MADDFQLALAKGCLVGLGLAVAWFLVGGLLYLVARSLGLDQGVSLAIGIGGGPVVVSAVVLGGFVLRARSSARSPTSWDGDRDATATWDDT